MLYTYLILSSHSLVSSLPTLCHRLTSWSVLDGGLSSTPPLSSVCCQKRSILAALLPTAIALALRDPEKLPLRLPGSEPPPVKSLWLPRSKDLARSRMLLLPREPDL